MEAFAVLILLGVWISEPPLKVTFEKGKLEVSDEKKNLSEYNRKTFAPTSTIIYRVRPSVER